MQIRSLGWSGVEIEAQNEHVVIDPLNDPRAVFDRGVDAVSPNGVIGDPRRADAERGERYWEHTVETVVEQLG